MGRRLRRREWVLKKGAHGGDMVSPVSRCMGAGCGGVTA